MAWRIPTWSRALGSATSKLFWSLLNSEPQWMVGMALAATQRMMKTTSPTISSAALTTSTATTRSVATWRSMTWAVPNQVRPRKIRYQHTKNPKSARQQGQLVEDHPHQAEGGDGGGDQQGHVGHPHVAGPDGIGQPPRAGASLPVGTLPR